MKTLFLECNMGAADTMLLSALYDACEQKSAFIEMINNAFAPFGITVLANPVSKCGVFGTRISFHIPELTPAAPDMASDTGIDGEPGQEHSNYLLAHVMKQEEQELAKEALEADDTDNTPSLPASLEELSLPVSVMTHIAAIYQLLNTAAEKLCAPMLTPLPLESEKDAVLLVNIAGCALLLDMMAPEQIICSPLHIGHGFVKSGKHIVSAPAPLTAELLKGIPSYSSSITGALLDDVNTAVIKYFVTRFGLMPAMTIQQIGYGIGANDFEIANYTRAFFGDTELAAPPSATAQNETAKEDALTENFSYMDTIYSIACNADDMTGEALSLAAEILLSAGAIDVYTTAIQMKKSRPGVLLTCLCTEEDKEKFIRLFFLHTSAQEVRYQAFTRAKLESTLQ